jgi:curved DNA binding protein|uniref:Peptidase M24 domain-containing protein n=1 Tax=Calcidiscus leptoporus TaxID=127549 RepID=A0A7S0IWN7_9EUKA|mmetsp:Transcript_26961/g.62961  ORF Transcript_26961/g.62961 Transcript_26961/m.62961 type:complete len:411 (+) Transcript_26961:175-1407(+)
MPKKKEEEESDVSSVEVDDEEEEEEEDEESANDLNNSDIVTKYRNAGDIANNVLAELIKLVEPGKKAVDLCEAGDKMVAAATEKVYNQKKKGKKIEKGSAFPTCISVNNCVGHYSPLTSEDDIVIAEGDLVKIDLGVHIDGYIAVLAHSVVAGSTEEAVTGRKADVMMAAWTAAECAQRMFKEGATNVAITEMIAKVAEAYKCSPVEGVLSHQMKKHVIDANKVIINKVNNDQQVKDATMERNDVMGFDIVMSTGEGKPKQSERRTTVFKRDLEEKYSLKMKASRAFFSEVNARFPTLPFTLRAGDERNWRMGVVECVKHGLFIEYPVLYEKPDHFVAQVKFTALLLPSGNCARLTSGPPLCASSELAVEDPELIELLAQSTDKKKKKKNNKKKKATKAGEGGDEAEADD